MITIYEIYNLKTGKVVDAKPYIIGDKTITFLTNNKQEIVFRNSNKDGNLKADSYFVRIKSDRMSANGLYKVDFPTDNGK